MITSRRDVEVFLFLSGEAFRSPELSAGNQAMLTVFWSECYELD